MGEVTDEAVVVVAAVDGPEMSSAACSLEVELVAGAEGRQEAWMSSCYPASSPAASADVAVDMVADMMRAGVAGRGQVHQAVVALAVE